MFSVLFVVCGEIRQLGPFATEEGATAAARAAQENDEGFSVYSQDVVLLTPEHRIQRYSINDQTPWGG